MSNPEFTAPDYTSQDAATYKANIDASIAANADWVNLGCSYSAGTFTIHGAQGTALSATNPAFVKFQDAATPGQIKYISVEANQAFIDDAGASEIINNLFGATSGVAWANDVPFYIYAVANDAMSSVAFMISRVPHRATAPAVGEIGAPDDAVADEQYSFFSFDNIDETLYDGNPCVCIGSIRMQMSSSDDWTVQALTTTDGIGQFQEGIWFQYPTGQNGAVSGGHILSNAGTEPLFNDSDRYRYNITKDGYCNVFTHLNGVNNSPSGTQTVQWTVPLDADTDGLGSPGSFACTMHQLDNSTGGHGRQSTPFWESSGAVFRSWDVEGTFAGTAGDQLRNNDFATSDDVHIGLHYLIRWD